MIPAYRPWRKRVAVTLREAVQLGTEHALKLLEDTEYQRLMEGEESLQN